MDYSHVSQMACSQQGSLYALTASLLQIAQRNLIGMSSGARELAMEVSTVSARISRYDAIDVLNQLKLSICQRCRHDCFAGFATSYWRSYAKLASFRKKSEVAARKRGTRGSDSGTLQVFIDFEKRAIEPKPD
jgi:hypothetical protein